MSKAKNVRITCTQFFDDGTKKVTVSYSDHTPTVCPSCGAERGVLIPAPGTCPHVKAVSP